MFDAKANAAAIDRVNKKRNDRARRAFKFIFKSPEGRAFINDLAETCHMYDATRNIADEGARLIALMLRERAIEYGYFKEWQLAERESREFQTEIKRMLEQTEVKENDGFDI
jgi:hypothetical protein